MNPTTATAYQRVEDCLVASACQLEKALSALGQLPSDRQQRLALIRLLKASHLIESAGDALTPRLEEASATLVPEAAESGLDF